MIRRISAFILLMTALPVLAQSSPDAARSDGKAFGAAKAAAAQTAATKAPDATRIPGYNGTPAQSGYFGDPDRMAREAASQRTYPTTQLVGANACTHFWIMDRMLLPTSSHADKLHADSSAARARHRKDQR